MLGLYWGSIRAILEMLWGYIWILEHQMETTIPGLGFSVLLFRCHWKPWTSILGTGLLWWNMLMIQGIYMGASIKLELEALSGRPITRI